MVMSWLQDAVPAHHGASVPQALKFPMFEARQGYPLSDGLFLCLPQLSLSQKSQLSQGG